VRQLSAQLALAYTSEPDGSLPDLLADAIIGVAGEHRVTCDLTSPSTLASTVCMLREGRDQVEYLLLCDSRLILDQSEQTAVVTDSRSI
jgi:hypothetical protein